MKSDSQKLQSISELHRMLDLQGPTHPLITVLGVSERQLALCRLPVNHVLTFYQISIVNRLDGKIKYGQGYYDFDEGSLLFAAPNQVMGVDMASNNNNSGLLLLIHPDFLKGYPLARKIAKYGFFSYATNEALHLSEQEKTTIMGIYTIIQEELKNRLDDFSHEVIIAQIELLLSYAKRFYKRQFLTRQAASSDVVQQLEELLDRYFEDDTAIAKGVPSVQYLADALNYTPDYLSDMLRSVTGLNAQQHIHMKVIDKAKELLSSTGMNVNEVAYLLGFEHPQSFSRLFKLKTNVSPAQYRSGFN
jgi:AraC-like DNA-binding protein